MSSAQEVTEMQQDLLSINISIICLNSQNDGWYQTQEMTKSPTMPEGCVAFSFFYTAHVVKCSSASPRLECPNPAHFQLSFDVQGLCNDEADPLS